MKIATYNVNGISSRLPVLLRWLKASEPDIACLQELKAPDEKFPEEALAEAGYKAVWCGQKSWNGVAILTKPQYTLSIVHRALPGDDSDENSRYIEADVSGIRIACLYLPNGNPAPGPKFDYKLSWFKRLHRHAQSLLKLDCPVVMTGDYNVIPEEQDAYKPANWEKDALFLPESRAAYNALLAQGWTDALRTLYPEEKIYTYWDYFRQAYQRNAGIRIDHFLLNEKMKQSLRSGGVDREVRGWEKTSDHAPVWIKTEVSPV